MRWPQRTLFGLLIASRQAAAVHSGLEVSRSGEWQRRAALERTHSIVNTHLLYKDGLESVSGQPHRPPSEALRERRSSHTQRPQQHVRNMRGDATSQQSRSIIKRQSSYSESDPPATDYEYDSDSDSDGAVLEFLRNAQQGDIAKLGIDLSNLRIDEVRAEPELAWQHQPNPPENLLIVSSRSVNVIFGLPGIKIDCLLTSIGMGVDVYVVDNGLATRSSALGGIAHPFVTSDEESVNHYPEHGTCMASIVSSPKYGVSKRSNIYAVTLDSQRPLSIPLAFAYIADRHGQRMAKKRRGDAKGYETRLNFKGSIVVVGSNLFSGWPADREHQKRFYQATRILDELGILVIAPAGSQGESGGLFCGLPGVLCVGSINRDYNPADGAVVSPAIQLWAPSDTRTITCASADGGSQTWDTQVDAPALAAAHVAGTAALMISWIGQQYDTTQNNFYVRNLLMTNAARGMIGTISDVGRPVIRNLLVNTGVENATEQDPFAVGGIVTEMLKEGSYKNNLPPSMVSKASCMSDPRFQSSIESAEKILLRLEYERGHTNLYPGAKQYYHMVPCVDDTCIELFSQKSTWRVDVDSDYVSWFVRHIIVKCMADNKVAGSMYLGPKYPDIRVRVGPRRPLFEQPQTIPPAVDQSITGANLDKPEVHIISQDTSGLDGWFEDWAITNTPSTPSRELLLIPLGEKLQRRALPTDAAGSPSASASPEEMDIDSPTSDQEETDGPGSINWPLPDAMPGLTSTDPIDTSITDKPGVGMHKATGSVGGDMQFSAGGSDAFFIPQDKKVPAPIKDVVTELGNTLPWLSTLPSTPTLQVEVPSGLNWTNYPALTEWQDKSAKMENKKFMWMQRVRSEWTVKSGTEPTDSQIFAALAKIMTSDRRQTITSDVPQDIPKGLSFRGFPPLSTWLDRTQDREVILAKWLDGLKNQWKTRTGQVPTDEMVLHASQEAVEQAKIAFLSSGEQSQNPAGESSPPRNPLPPPASQEIGPRKRPLDTDYDESDAENVPPPTGKRLKQRPGPTGNEDPDDNESDGDDESDGEFVSTLTAERRRKRPVGRRITGNSNSEEASGSSSGSRKRPISLISTDDDWGPGGQPRRPPLPVPLDAEWDHSGDPTPADFMPGASGIGMGDYTFSDDEDPDNYGPPDEHLYQPPDEPPYQSPDEPPDEPPRYSLLDMLNMASAPHKPGESSKNGRPQTPDPAKWPETGAFRPPATRAKEPANVPDFVGQAGPPSNQKFEFANTPLDKVGQNLVSGSGGSTLSSPRPGTPLQHPSSEGMSKRGGKVIGSGRGGIKGKMNKRTVQINPSGTSFNSADPGTSSTTPISTSTF